MKDKKKVLKETLPEYTVENKEYKTMPKKWTIDGKDRYIGEQDRSGKMWYEHIYQFDDLVDAELQEELSKMITAPGWQYGCIGNHRYEEWIYNKKEDESDTKAHGVKFLDQYWEMSFNGNIMYSWQQNNFRVHDLWKIIRTKISEDFVDMDLDILDCTAHGITESRFGLPHADDQDGQIWIIVYYVNPIWKPEWDGATIFYKGVDTLEDEEPEIIKSVYPKPGRFLFFNSMIPRAGMQPNKFFPGLRTTLLFKCMNTKQGLKNV